MGHAMCSRGKFKLCLSSSCTPRRSDDSACARDREKSSQAAPSRRRAGFRTGYTKHTRHRESNYQIEPVCMRRRRNAVAKASETRLMRDADGGFRCAHEFKEQKHGRENTNANWSATTSLKKRAPAGSAGGAGAAKGHQAEDRYATSSGKCPSGWTEWARCDGAGRKVERQCEHFSGGQCKMSSAWLSDQPACWRHEDS